MVFLKLVLTESQVNYKTQLFWVKVVHLVPNVQTLAGHQFGTNNYLHFDTVLKTKYLVLHWIFLFFTKIRLEIPNV